MQKEKTQKLWTWEEAHAKREEWLTKDKTVVFTNGCFDLIHSGHVFLLGQAAKLGNYLIVGINSDESIRRIKGQGRPLRPEEERAELVGGLACVAGVVIFGQDDPLKIITLLQPDVLVKGGDWNHGNIIGADVVEKRGGRVVVIPFIPGRSTTALVEFMRHLR